MSLTASVSGLGQWWLNEFLALFPERISERLLDRGLKCLVLSREAEAILLDLTNDRGRSLASSRVSRTDDLSEQIDAFLRSHGSSRRHVSVGVRLAPDRIFRRQLVLPAEARSSVDAIVVQDLIGKTPFQLDDVYHDHVARQQADKILIRQWVVRREFVTDAAADLGLDIREVDFVDCALGDKELESPQRLNLQDRDGSGSWFRKTVSALLLSAVMLAALACGAKYWRQQALLDQLAVEIATVRPKAQLVRSMADKLEKDQASLVHLRSQKRDAPGLLDILDEVTKVLPAGSWLTELRLSDAPERRGQEIVMTGFSGAAASLVGIVDRSPLFADTALIAPIAFDRIEQSERFVLRTKVRTSPGSSP